jgi:hypothetical protein
MGARSDRRGLTADRRLIAAGRAREPKQNCSKERGEKRSSIRGAGALGLPPPRLNGRTMVQSEPADLLVRLRSVPLFADLGEESLKLVADHVAEFEARRGHLLAQPGQPGAGLFILLDGRVRAELPTRTVELGPGEFFGELALLDEAAVHMGRVVSDSDIRCLALSRDDFDELLRTEPTIAVAMLRVLARRLASVIR